VPSFPRNRHRRPASALFHQMVHLRFHRAQPGSRHPYSLPRAVTLTELRTPPSPASDPGLSSHPGVSAGLPPAGNSKFRCQGQRLLSGIRLYSLPTPSQCCPGRRPGTAFLRPSHTHGNILTRSGISQRLGKCSGKVLEPVFRNQWGSALGVEQPPTQCAPILKIVKVAKQDLKTARHQG